MKSKMIAVMLIVSLLFGAFGTYYSFAASKTELNNQSSALDSKIAEKKEEIEEVESNLSAALKDVQTLVSQISAYEQAISDLDSKIENVASQITQTENDIAQKEKETEEKQDLLNKRLIAIYESGNTSYLDMLLTSSDLSDFLSKYYLISEIAEYDTNLIISLKEARASLEVAKTELETNKQALENAKKEQVEKQEALKKIKAEKDSKVASLNSEEKALESELEEFEKDKKAIQAELARLAKIEAEEAARRAAAGKTSTNVTSNPSAAGYIFPIPGLSKANIRTLKYPSYAGHTGVDINIGVVGKNIVAVKSGTVAISTALRYSNGNYKSYGEYVVINHHDGTMTLYGHMLSGSRRVSPGDEVSQGQVIGTVGSTGNSTGPHLHFEVRVGGSPVNPIQYLP
ncbi:MAG: peptidoglycan DD-metalloendopeptidase family protein [Clostridia bacterium]|nr:peptidoglycan DD-metalloendopeptidase family protein [Clostridia bacterium]